MNTDSNYYVEYEVDLSKLKEWEFEALRFLKEASKIIAKLYSKQRNSEYKGANFYPHDATKEEIEKAYKLDPLILNPYTTVKRNEKGELYAVDYYKEYKNGIDSICSYIKSAENVFRTNGDLVYANYLKELSNDLRKNNGFQKSTLLWLKIENKSGIDIKIGPIETYLDKLFAVKKAYQANLRIANEESASHVDETIEIIKSLQPDLPFDETDQVKLNVRMDYVVSMAGWHAELVPRGSNYPTDAKIMKKEKVAKILIYSNNIERRDGVLFDKVMPLLFTDELVNTLDRDKFMENWVRFIIHHELTEEVAKYRYGNYEKRLGAYSDVVRELYSTLVGIKTASVQILKGVLTVEDYKYLLIELLLVSFKDWVISVNGNSGLKAYSDGYVWCINYLFKEGALSLDSDKKIDIDFTKIYTGIDLLVSDLTHFMVDGEESEVKEEITKYSDTKIFEIFKSDIEKIISIS